MNGAWASLASRREISVLPTPVGPIIRMFFGLTSARSSGASCWRRQRFLSATATARLASFWPTMLRSSSETISRGEKLVSLIGCLFLPGARPARPAAASGLQRLAFVRVDGFERHVLVGVDADLGGDLHRLAGDRL